MSDPEDKSQLDAGQSRILGLLRKILLWDWLRGRRGKPRQAGAIVSYVFVALVIIAAATGPSSHNETSSKAAAAPTQSSSSAPTATTAVSTTTTSATSTPESTPKKRPAKKSTVLRPATRPAPNPEPIQACITGGGYGGIGASLSSFKSQNPTAGMPPPPYFQIGIAYYEINATKRGCVSEYTITESTTPTQSSRDLLSLVAGISLPNDARVLVNHNSCEAWSSASLKKATGEPDAVGSVQVAPEGEGTGIVDMSVSSTQC